MACPAARDADAPISAEGELSVIQFSLPGGAFDGSSCFNFMKETIHRYCGGAPNRVLTGVSTFSTAIIT